MKILSYIISKTFNFLGFNRYLLLTLGGKYRWYGYNTSKMEWELISKKHHKK